MAVVVGALEIELRAGLARLQQDVTQGLGIVTSFTKKVEQTAGIASKALGAIGVGLSVAGFVAFIKGAIDAADHLNDLTQSLGINLAGLAKYQLATSQSGTSLEALGKGIKGVSAAFTEHGAELRKLGLDATTQDGRMRQLADVFAKMPDGIEKTTLAVHLFGKSGMELIPMLNMGAEGLDAAAEKSARYAAVLATLAPRADEFNDTMAELAMASKVASLALIRDALPAMTEIAKAMALAAHEAGGLQAAWVGLGGIGWELIFKPLKTIILGITIDIQEMNVKLLKFFGQAAEAARIEKEIIGLYKEIAEDTRDAPAMAGPKVFDEKKWKADYAALLAALGIGNAKAAKEVKDLDSAYRALIRSIGEKTAAMMLELSGQEKQTDAEKLALDTRLKLQDGTLKLTTAQKEKVATDLENLLATEKALKARTREMELTAAYVKLLDALEDVEQAGIVRNVATVHGIEDANQQLQFEITTLGLTAAAMALANVERSREVALRGVTSPLAIARINQLYDEQKALVAVRDAGAPAADFDKQIKQLQFETTLLGLSNVEREKAIALRALEASAIDKQSEAYGDLVRRMLAAIDGDAAKRKLLEFNQKWIEFGKNLEEALTNAFMAGRDGARQFLDWLKAEFLKTELRPLIKLGVGSALGALGLGSGTASAADLGPILGSIGKWFTGSGGVSGYGGAGDPGGFSAMDRSLSSNSMPALFEKWLGPNAPLLQGIAQVATGVTIGLGVGGALARAIGGDDIHPLHSIIGTVVGGIIGANWGFAGAAIGSAVGGAVGGILDGLLNESEAMRKAIVAMGPSDYTYGSSGGKFGDIGIMRGSDEWFSDADMSQTLNAWFRSIGKLDAEVAKHFSGDEIARATQALAGQSMSLSFGLEHTGLDPETLSAIVKARFSAIFGVVDQQMADLVANFKGSGEDLVTLIVDLSTIHERLTGLHASLSTLFGQEVGFADIAALKGETEGYTEALQRLAGEYGVTNQIAEMLGKTQEEVWGSIGLASEGARAHLIALAGGLDKLSGQLDFYYTHFYSTQEQQAQTLGTLQQAFSDVGVAMPMTVDGFREITDRFLGMGEAGAQASASMLALAPTFYAYIQAVEAVDSSLKGNADTFKMLFGEAISLDAVRGLQQNGEVLTATLTRITSEFAATNELLSMFGLTSEQVFGAFGLASEAARAKLIELSGGLDAFTANLSSFYANYFTETERHERSLSSTQTLFASLGLTMPTTTEGFRTIVEQQLALGPSGAKAAAALLGVQQQFFDLYKPVNDMADAIGRLRGAIETERGPMPGTTGRPGWVDSAQAQIDAENALKAATEAATNALATQTDLWGQFATDEQKLARATREVNDGFAALGVAVPQSGEMFANLVLSIDPATAAGQQFLEFLKLIAPAFHLTMAAIASAPPAVPQGPGSPYYVPILEDEAAKAAAILNQRLELLAQIHEFTGNKAGAAAVLEQQHAIALAALDPSLRALQTQLWGLEAAAAAAAKQLEFTKTRRQLEIDLQKALGNDAIALEMERADVIAELTAKWGDQAGELIDIYRRIWEAQDAVASSGAGWVKTLQDWLRSLQLDTTLSPLTATQRFDFAQQQYIEDLLKAQGGDADARARYTQGADALLREALSMYGRASTDYMSIFRMINDETQGLIAQGLAPTAPVTTADLNTSVQSAGQTARAQMDALLAKVDTMNGEISALRRENRADADRAQAGNEELVETTETGSRNVERAVQSQPSPGARLT